MITRQRTLFYFVGDHAFKDLVEAQQFDLANLMPDDLFSISPPMSAEEKQALAKWMLTRATELVDILTTTPKSRARARKSNGATRKRKTPKLTPAVYLSAYV
jgi:hypothetical protein